MGNGPSCTLKSEKQEETAGNHTAQAHQLHLLFHSTSHLEDEFQFFICRWTRWFRKSINIFVMSPSDSRVRYGRLK